MFDIETASVASNVTEQASLLSLVAVWGKTWEWWRIAAAVEETGSASRIISGDFSGFEPDDAHALYESAAVEARSRVAKYEELIEEQRDAGKWLTTVLDKSYPTNLREIYNRPPFLFVQGSFAPKDQRAVAVVGTRQASDEGLALARELAGNLAARGVTILSGLARGIDGAAHGAALDAGGRTIAVMGTGINRRYPAEHSDLAERVSRAGALVSQFWPDGPPSRWGFPMRNVTMSGMGIGTVVIEASSTSGAKMQARLALEHGKRAFLVDSLVTEQEWAQNYVERRGAEVVYSTDDILKRLGTADNPPEQLALA